MLGIAVLHLVAVDARAVGVADPDHLLAGQRTGAVDVEVAGADGRLQRKGLEVDDGGRAGHQPDKAERIVLGRRGVDGRGRRRGDVGGVGVAQEGRREGVVELVERARSAGPARFRRVGTGAAVVASGLSVAGLSAGLNNLPALLTAILGIQGSGVSGAARGMSGLAGWGG